MSTLHTDLLGRPDRPGTFTRSDVLSLGLDDRAIQRAIRAGEWTRVRPGVYAPAELWAAASPTERHRLLTLAVLERLGPAAAASHQSAAVLHGVETWGIGLGKAHVTRLDGGAGRSERDVVHHEGLLLPEDLVTLDGAQVVRPARATLECALLTDIEHGLAVVDSGLRKGLLTPAKLTEQLALMGSWPGAQHLQVVRRLADGRSASVGESRSRFLFWLHAIPAPELQFEVRDGHRLVGVSDFAWPDAGLLGEFDGKAKYERYLRPGESPADAVFREKRREDLLREITGWRVIRLTWSDLDQPAATAARVRRMLKGRAV